jgi:hypothetical protein
MKSSLSILVAASSLALLSACGGDGGGTPPVDSQGLHITSDNEQAVARASVTGGLSVANIETATNAGGSAAQPTDVAGRAHTLSVVLQRALAAGVKSRVAGASEHPAATHSASVACGVSGSLTTTFDDVDNDSMLSKGDVLSVQFDQCRDSTTSLLNGKAVITLTSTPSATQIGANADFQNVTSVEGGLTSTIQGAVAVSEIDSDTDSTTTMSFVAQMAITLASATYDDELLIDGGTHIVIDQQLAAGRSTLSFDGVLRAQSLTVAAAVTLQTVSPLVQLDADAFPSSGVIKARGNQGTLLMTVLNATTVQLQLDANDDGTYDSTQTVAWSTLVP